MKTQIQRVLIVAGIASTIATMPVSAQTVLFDFNDAPIQTSLPIDLTWGGIHAHFAATGGGFSVLDTSTAPVVPTGFTGRFLYPNGLGPADLLVSFDRQLVYFSILYSPQELGCADSATMRLSAFMGTALVGSVTKTATNPGTWPVDVLQCNFPQGFDNVVIHHDSPPPTCQNNGPIFMAEDMRVLAVSSNGAAAFCFGDGTSVACPCGHGSRPAHGCSNNFTIDGAGAYLSSSGLPSIASDSLVLTTTGTFPNTPGVYFQGSTATAIVFGNGIQCASGVMYRLENSVAVGIGTSSTTVPIHLLGATAPGQVRYYQQWYRDAPTYCPFSGFNFTNALSVTWLP